MHRPSVSALVVPASEAKLVSVENSMLGDDAKYHCEEGNSHFRCRMRKRSRPFCGNDETPCSNVTLASPSSIVRKRPDDPSTPTTVTTSSTLSSTTEYFEPNSEAKLNPPWEDRWSSLRTLFPIEHRSDVHLSEQEESILQVEFVERTTREMQDIVQYWYDDPSIDEDPLHGNTLWSLCPSEVEDSPLLYEEVDYSKSIDQLFQSIVPLKSWSPLEEDDGLFLERTKQLYNPESMLQWQIKQHLQFHASPGECWIGSNMRRRCCNVVFLVLMLSAMVILSQLMLGLYAMYQAILACPVLDSIPSDFLEVLLALIIVLIL